MKSVVLAAALVALSAQMALAQFAPGAKVFAAPTTSGDWYSGCTVVGGPNDNGFYQVSCAGTTWWVNGQRVSATAPQPQPGQRITITPSDPVAPKAAAAMKAPAPAAAMRAPAAQAAMGPGHYGHDIPGAPGPGNYAPAMAANIAADKKAANAVSVLKPGKYTCYAGGQYTFTDLIIKSATSYSDSRGNSGSYSIAGGVLTFTSGPYKGA